MNQQIIERANSTLRVTVAGPTAREAAAISYENNFIRIASPVGTDCDEMSVCHESQRDARYRRPADFAATLTFRALRNCFCRGGIAMRRTNHYQAVPLRLRLGVAAAKPRGPRSGLPEFWRAICRGRIVVRLRTASCAV